MISSISWAKKNSKLSPFKLLFVTHQLLFSELLCAKMQSVAFEIFKIWGGYSPGPLCHHLPHPALHCFYFAYHLCIKYRSRYCFMLCMYVINVQLEIASRPNIAVVMRWKWNWNQRWVNHLKHQQHSHATVRAVKQSLTLFSCLFF